MYQLSQALEYLHKQEPPIIHGNIKGVSVPELVLEYLERLSLE